MRTLQALAVCASLAAVVAAVLTLAMVAVVWWDDRQRDWWSE